MNEEFINIPEDKNDDKDEIKPKIIVNLSFLSYTGAKTAYACIADTVPI